MALSRMGSLGWKEVSMVAKIGSVIQSHPYHDPIDVLLDTRCARQSLGSASITTEGTRLGSISTMCKPDRSLRKRTAPISEPYPECFDR